MGVRMRVLKLRMVRFWWDVIRLQGRIGYALSAVGVFTDCRSTFAMVGAEWKLQNIAWAYLMKDRAVQLVF
jgi:hypothetical protein